jgi:hypothetical protein
VRRDGDSLAVCTRDEARRFDLPSVMAQIQGWALVNQFDMLRPTTHRPRVTIDRLVVLRESWAFGATELSFAFEPDEAERFLSARRWARRHSLPREVFVRTPGEAKPFWVAFDSPLTVNALSIAVRRAVASVGASLLFTEMLPGSDQAWLTDREGRAYTSELRMVALDLRPAVR